MITMSQLKSGIFHSIIGIFHERNLNVEHGLCVSENDPPLWVPPRDTVDPVVLTPQQIRQATFCTDNKSPPNPYWSNWYFLFKIEMVTTYTMFTTTSDSLHQRHKFHVVALTYAQSPYVIVYYSSLPSKFRTKAVHGSILNFTYKPLTPSTP